MATKKNSVSKNIMDSLEHHKYLEKIKILLKNKYNLDVYQYRTPYFLRRISMISKKLKTNDLFIIYKHIKGSHQGYLDFLNTLTIHVTQFFRNKSLWVFLRDKFFYKFFNGDIKNKPRRSNPYKIWVAGCSSGQEPYSLAIMLVESYKKYRKTKNPKREWNKRMINIVPFEIFAVDINQNIINEAKKGKYSKKTLKNADKKIIEDYFIQENGDFIIIPEIVKKVKFKKLNLFKDVFPTQFDLITCRNVVIYFTKDQQQLLFKKFWKSLKKGGHMITGKTEMLPPESKKYFELINLPEHLYLRKNVVQ